MEKSREATAPCGYHLHGSVARWMVGVGQQSQQQEKGLDRVVIFILKSLCVNLKCESIWVCIYPLCNPCSCFMTFLVFFLLYAT